MISVCAGVLVVLVSFAYITHRIRKERKEAEASLEQQRAQAWKRVEAIQAVKDQFDANKTPKPRAVLTPDTIAQSYATPRPTYAPSTTQSVRQSSDPDLLTTMILADMMNNNKDVSMGRVEWQGDVPTIKETYSAPVEDTPKPSYSSSYSSSSSDDDSRSSYSSSYSSSSSDSSYSSSSSDSSYSSSSSD